MSRFAAYAWTVLFANIGVVLWGAFVRATGSGAGCGEHWPLCNGEIVPRATQAATLIELTHRLTSGLALVLVIGLVIWAFRAFPKGHSIRWTAGLSLAFTLSEALIGAGLVLLGHVAKNQSTARAVSLSVHLTNTLILLASLAITAWLASSRRAAVRGPLPQSYWIALFATIMVGITGAITALGDTLFRSTSLAEGLRNDFSPTAHLFVRLRVVHPVLAIAAGLYLLYLASRALSSRTGAALFTLVLLQITAGAINIALLAPVWMQIVHLLIADAVWITLVLLCAEAVWPPVPVKVKRPELVCL